MIKYMINATNFICSLFISSDIGANCSWFVRRSLHLGKFTNTSLFWGFNVVEAHRVDTTRKLISSACCGAAMVDLTVDWLWLSGWAWLWLGNYRTECWLAVTATSGLGYSWACVTWRTMMSRQLSRLCKRRYNKTPLMGMLIFTIHSVHLAEITHGTLAGEPGANCFFI